MQHVVFVVKSLFGVHCGKSSTMKHYVSNDSLTKMTKVNTEADDTSPARPMWQSRSAQTRNVPGSNPGWGTGEIIMTDYKSYKSRWGHMPSAQELVDACKEDFENCPAMKVILVIDDEGEYRGG